jgi:predicted NAD/FAD-dependent oxidoreductase
MLPSPDVFIVGADLAGLCCACKLWAKGGSFLVLDASLGFGNRAAEVAFSFLQR